MNRLERLYAISDLLRRESPWPVSASRLADRFDVSRRTIERDVAALRYGGLPLHTVDGPRGGVALSTTPPRTLLSLSPAELTALVLAAANAGAMPYGYAASSAIAKLLDALPVDDQSAGRRPPTSDPRRAGHVPAPVAGAVRTKVEEAVRTGMVIAIHVPRSQRRDHPPSRRAGRVLRQRRTLVVGGVVPFARRRATVPLATDRARPADTRARARPRLRRGARMGTRSRRRPRRLDRVTRQSTPPRQPTTLMM